MLYFSPSTRGFYDDRIHGSIPSDKVEISAEERAAALDSLEPGLEIVAGPDGKPVAAPIALDAAEALIVLRARRDKLLRASDRTQIPDYPISAEERDAWATYRQALRDLPETTGDPAAVIWPISPEEQP